MKKKVFVSNAKSSALLFYLLQKNIPFQAYQAAKGSFFIFSTNEKGIEKIKKLAYFSLIDGKVMGGYGKVASISPKLIKEAGIRQNKKDVTLREAFEKSGLVPNIYTNIDNQEYLLIDVDGKDIKKLADFLLQIAGNGLHKEEIAVSKKNGSLSTIVTLKKVQFKKGASFNKTAKPKNGAGTKGSSGVLETM